MLGIDIILRACVLNYYNCSIESVQFLAHSEMYPKYFISRQKHILIVSGESWYHVSLIEVYRSHHQPPGCGGV